MRIEDIRQHIKRADVVWIGEVHGVKQNYAAHKFLLSELLGFGFNKIFWEMPEDKKINFEDGRFNTWGISLLNWLEDLAKKKEICLHLFDRRHTLNPQSSAQQFEDLLTSELKKNLEPGSVVITGNFHSQLRQALLDSVPVIPCALQIKKLFPMLNFLIIGYRYAGGYAFNYEKLEIGNNYHAYDHDALPFGTFVENSDSDRDEHFWFSVGIAESVKDDIIANPAAEK